MRLQKFLSRAGVASRREAEGLIAAGRVAVNGRVVTEPGTRVAPEVDRVQVDGRAVGLPAPRWIAFHKPAGVLTTARDTHGRRTVYDVLGPGARGLRYVGRLDRDTTGLLLLTNEGDVAERLLRPARGVEREYRALVRGGVAPEALERLLRGVTLDDGPARARAAEALDERGGNTELRLVLTEGRKREVRRMLDAVGHPVLALRRVRFGPVELGDLPEGEWRELNEDEVRALTEAAGPGAGGEDP
ncbi:MAG: rRNA pseudouridine synthase [Gemmatimonadetes bacterium]|nr:MAG: rRNA pseudouridine synthase [Gemmatimonadota bacterium]